MKMRKFLIGKMNNLYYEYRNDKHYEHNIENEESSVMEKKTHRFKQNAKSKHETDKPLDLVISSKNEDKYATKRLKRTALPNPDTEPASKRSNVVKPAESASKVAKQPHFSAAREDLPMENSCTSEIPAEKSDERSCAKETEHVENSTQERPSVIRNTLNLMNSSSDPKILADPAFFTGLFTVIRDLHTSSVMTYSLMDHLSKTLIDNTKTMESVKKLLVGSHDSVSNTPTASSSKASITEVEKISDIKTNKKQKEQDDEGNDCNEVLKRKRCHKRKFVLPLEYDENDSRWTLKYREMAPGLVELMPHTNVYINAVKLSNCKRLSKDCNSLARMLLLEIFTQSALSICSLTGLRARAYDVEGAAVRPGLDENARTVLLTFVEEYGREKGWITVDTSSIQNCLRNKMTEMRSRYVM